MPVDTHTVLHAQALRLRNFSGLPVEFRFDGDEVIMEAGFDRIYPPAVAQAAERDLKHLGVVIQEVGETDEAAHLRALENMREWKQDLYVLAEGTVADHEGARRPVHPRHDHRPRLQEDLDELDDRIAALMTPKPKAKRKARAKAAAPAAAAG